MATPEDVLSLFGLHVGDMVLSKRNSMLLYKNDNAVPYGEITFEDGKLSIRCGFGTLRTTRTSMIKRNPHGISFIPVNQTDNYH